MKTIIGALLNPWVIIGAIAWTAFVAGSGFVGGVKYQAGVVAKRDFDAEQEKNRAILRVIENNDAERLENEAKARKVSKSHADELATIRAQFNADRAGGLRVTAAVCDSVTFKADSAGAGRADAAPPATVALPPEIERNLRELARDADEVTAIARALQEWARISGFYGPPEPAP